MNIIEHDLSFNMNKIMYMGYITHIVFHHTESVGQSVEDIHYYHRYEKGWAGIGYHFYIRKDGSIHEGRPLGYCGSHCPGKNSCGIGIAFEGNFMYETMTEEQIKSGNELVTYLKAQYGNLIIGCHRDYYSTDCPGINFRIDELTDCKREYKALNSRAFSFKQETQWLQILANQLGIKDSNGNPLVEDGLMGENTRYAIQHLPLLGLSYSEPIATTHIQNLLKVNADGIYGPSTYNEVRRWQREHGLDSDGIVGAKTWLSFA